jgi:hypothetical protein
MQLENAARLVDLEIALCGAALMLIGVAISSQIPPENSANAMGSAKDARGIVPLVPSVAGDFLTFFGALRISLTARPLRTVALGFVLLVVGSVAPFCCGATDPLNEKLFLDLPFSLASIRFADRRTHLSLNSATAASCQSEGSDLEQQWKGRAMKLESRDQGTENGRTPLPSSSKSVRRGLWCDCLPFCNNRTKANG